MTTEAQTRKARNVTNMSGIKNRFDDSNLSYGAIKSFGRVNPG